MGKVLHSLLSEDCERIVLGRIVVCIGVIRCRTSVGFGYDVSFCIACYSNIGGPDLAPVRIHSDVCLNWIIVECRSRAVVRQTCPHVASFFCNLVKCRSQDSEMDGLNQTLRVSTIEL